MNTENTITLQDTCMSCAACCHDTEMLISPADMERVSALGYTIDSFSTIDPETGERMLKNINGSCVFLEGKGPYTCKIYHARPKGCRFFPLIYDQERGRCILDREYCPHWRDFTWMETDETRVRGLLDFLKYDLQLF